MSERSLEELKETWNRFPKIAEDYSDPFMVFVHGYNLAQKEMQEKLDAAIEVIKFYGNTNNWDLDQLLERYNDGYDGEDGCCGQKARDFLKARGE